MVADRTTPEKLNLTVDFSEEIKGQTRQELESLKDQLAKDLAGDLTRLVVLCRNNKIKYSQWTEGDLDSKKIEEIRGVLGQTKSGERLCVSLASSDPAQRKGAEQILEKIVGLMETQESKVQEFKGEKEALSKDVLTETLGDVTNSLKKTIATKPWQTIAALAVAGIAVNYFWNHEQVGKAVRGATAAVVLGWAGNFFTGAFTGKTAVQHIVDWAREDGNMGDHMDAFLRNFEGDDRVDAGTLRNAFKLGSIPFNVFLQQYELAKSSGSTSIDMKALKRRATGLGIDTAAFDDEHGAELFALVEHFADNARYKGKKGTAALKAKYGDEVDGDKPFTFWQVVMIEELEDPEGIRPKEDGTGKVAQVADRAAAGAVTAATGAATEAVSETGYETYEEELLSILPFQNTNLVLEEPTVSDDATGISSGNGKLMGFELQYERREDDEGTVQYALTVGAAIQTITLGESFDRNKQATKAEALKGHLRGRMQAQIKATPLLSEVNEKTVDWREKKWTVYHTGAPTAPFLQHQPRNVALEVRPTPTGTVEVLLYGDKLTGTELLQTFIDRRATAEVIRQQVPAFRDVPEADLRVESIQVPFDPTKSSVVRGSVVGGALELKWNPSDKAFHVVRFELSPTFITRKIEAAQADPQLTKIFNELEDKGEALSTWWRGAMDILTTQMPDREDHQWTGLVDFKRNEIFRLYEGRLRAIDPTDPDILTKIQQAYDDTVGGAIHTLESYPGKLGDAQLRGDQDSYDRMEHEILTYGWSSSYEGAYMDFMALVGPSNINMPGCVEDSNPKQKAVVGYLMGHWSRVTASVAHVDFPNVHGNVYHDYLQRVQQEIAGIVAPVLKTPTTATKRGYVWEQFLKNGVDIEQLQAQESKFQGLTKWEDYLRNYVGSPETKDFMHAQRPELKGQNREWRMEPIPGNPNQFRIRWYPGTATEFEAIMEVNPSTKVLEYRNLQLSEPWIDQHVDAIAVSPEFNKPFEDLRKRFEGIEVRAKGYFPGVWEYFNGIEQGAWRSMATYKRQELLDSYRGRLKGLLNQGLSPTAMAQAFDAEYRSFTDRYMKDVYRLNERMAAEILTYTSDDTPQLTEQEFTGFMRDLDFLGYGDRYLALMDGARRTLEASPYVGFDHPTDGVNAFLLLVHKKTSFMNRTTPKPEEEAYFKAVQDSALRVAQAAYANQVGTGNFVRASIGREEIPVELPIEDYAQWLPLHPSAGKSTLPPATPGAEKPHETTEALQLRDRLQSLYQDHWAKKVYAEKGVVRDGFDDENVEELDPLIKQQLEEIFNSVLYTSNSEEKEKFIAKFTRYLDECVEKAEAGWW